MGNNINENKNDEIEVAPPLAPRKRKKKKWFIIPIVILIIAALIFFFRKPILNIVRNIPFIGQLAGNSEMEGLSPEELNSKVISQESEIQSLKNQLATMQEANAALQEKNSSLKQYESMYTEFMEQKSTWDENVAKTNPSLFIEQFEKIYPDNADRIYASLKGEQVLSDKQKQVAATIGAMDEEKAAAALEKMVATDPELIKVLFSGMGKDSKAAILSEMSSDAAARVIKLISPDEALVQ